MTAGINNGLNGTIADSLTFGNAFPIANIDQSSQQFRDNFKILQASVENIQSKDITLTGPVTGTALIDSGSADITIATTLTGYVQLAGDTMTGNLILDGDPTAALQAATKQYVDGHIGGISVLNDASAVISTVTLLEFGDNLNVIDQGGGQVTINAVAGFSDPMTTRGDIMYRDTGNLTARLPVGTNTYVLTSDGTDVSWTAPAGGGISVVDDASTLITPVDTIEFSRGIAITNRGDDEIHVFTPFVSVTDYGAVGDGVTDDTAAFDAALADARGWDTGDSVNFSANPSRLVHVPAGTYLVSDLILFQGDRLSGEGVGNSVLQFNYTGPSHAILCNTHSSTSTGQGNYNQAHIIIENLKIMQQRPIDIGVATDINVGPYLMIHTHEYDVGSEWSTGVETSTNRIRGWLESAVADETAVTYEDMGTGANIGLVDGTTYYIHRQGSGTDSYKVYPTLGDAQGDTNELVLTSVGTHGTNTTNIQHFRYANSLPYTTTFMMTYEAPVVIRNCRFEVRGGEHVLWMRHNNVDWDATGHRFVSAVENCVFSGGGTEAIVHIGQSGSSPNENTVMRNCIIEPFPGKDGKWGPINGGVDFFERGYQGTLQTPCGLDLTHAHGVTVENVTVYGVYGKSWYEGRFHHEASGHGFIVTEQAQGLQIINCKASNCGGSGFYINMEDMSLDSPDSPDVNITVGVRNILRHCGVVDNNQNPEFALTSANETDCPAYWFKQAINWDVNTNLMFTGQDIYNLWSYWAVMGRVRWCNFEFFTSASNKMPQFNTAGYKSFHTMFFLEEGILNHNCSLKVDGIRYQSGFSGQRREIRQGTGEVDALVGSTEFSGSTFINYNRRDIDGPLLMHREINTWMLQDYQDLLHYEFDGSYGFSGGVDVSFSDTNDSSYTLHIAGSSTRNLNRQADRGWGAEWDDPYPSATFKGTELARIHEFGRSGDIIYYDANGGGAPTGMTDATEYYMALISDGATRTTGWDRFIPNVDKIAIATSFVNATTLDQYAGSGGNRIAITGLGTGTNHRIYHRNIDVTGLLPLYQYEIEFENLVLSEDTDVYIHISEDQRHTWASTDEYDWGFDRTFITSNDHQGQNSDAKFMLAASVESTSQMSGTIKFVNPGNLENVEKYFDWDVKHICAASPFAGEITRVKGVGSYTSSASNKGEEITSIRIHPATGYILSGSYSVYKRYIGVGNIRELA